MSERFLLERALTYGTLPKIYLEDNIEERAAYLRAYVDNYLKEEIEAEAAVRNIGIFFVSYRSPQNQTVEHR